MNQYEQWNQTFGIANILHVDAGKGGLPVVHIHNALGEATIALQGAHILHFCPKGEQPIIWMSDDACFAAKKSLRGGVPICWPWFGAHEDNAKLPAHGYARTSDWLPTASQQHDDGTTSIRFTLNHDAVDSGLQVHPLRVDLDIRVGSSLNIRLNTTNMGATEYRLSEALHTYFHVGDVEKVQIKGLDGCDYLDKTADFQRKQQQGAVTIHQEVDRVYLDTPAQLCIEDEALKRNIIIESTGSHSAVVWNPWQETAQKMGDLGQAGYQHMLCVETANAADDSILLGAGNHHIMEATYRIE